MMTDRLVVLVYGALPGAVSGALVGTYHREQSLKYDALRWAERPGEPWGPGPGFVLGAFAGAILFMTVRRMWSRLPTPIAAVFAAGCVTLGGLILSASRVD
jgi:hypothetical protein